MDDLTDFRHFWRMGWYRLGQSVACAGKSRWKTAGKMAITCNSFKHIKSRYDATPTFTLTQMKVFHFHLLHSYLLQAVGGSAGICTPSCMASNSWMAHQIRHPYLNNHFLITTSERHGSPVRSAYSEGVALQTVDPLHLQVTLLFSSAGWGGVLCGMEMGLNKCRKKGWAGGSQAINMMPFPSM